MANLRARLLQIFDEYKMKGSGRQPPELRARLEPAGEHHREEANIDPERGPHTS